jgi:hypothetical protein
MHYIRNWPTTFGLKFEHKLVPRAEKYSDKQFKQVKLQLDQFPIMLTIGGRSDTLIWWALSMWVSAVRFKAKVLLQISHLYGLSPVWERSCNFMSRWEPNTFPQYSHVFLTSWLRSKRILLTPPSAMLAVPGPGKTNQSLACASWSEAN